MEGLWSPRYRISTYHCTVLRLTRLEKAGATNSELSMLLSDSDFLRDPEPIDNQCRLAYFLRTTASDFQALVKHPDNRRSNLFRMHHNALK